ncbi:hypothetical protein ABVT39_020545 [Epinephelus coioides]
MDLNAGKKKMDKVMTKTNVVVNKTLPNAVTLAEGEKTAAERDGEKGNVGNAGEGRRGEMVAVTSMTEREAVESGAAGSGAEKERDISETARELVVSVEVDGETEISMMELLRAVDNTCGRVLGCRARGNNRWEITMNNPKAEEITYMSGQEEEGEEEGEEEEVFEQDDEDGEGAQVSGMPAIQPAAREIRGESFHANLPEN